MKRRTRGRPARDDDDQIIVDVAAALKKAYRLGPQKARDLALALVEARVATPTRIPRGARKRSVRSLLVGYKLQRSTFEGRGTTIAQKVRRGALKPRSDVVAALLLILRAKNEDLARHTYAATHRLLPKRGVASRTHFLRHFEK